MDNKRNLKKFENQNAYDTQKDEVMGIPHVVLFEDTKKLVYASASKDPFNGHEYVDLGLPSGTLWATKAVGADFEEDYGLYFAWGSVEGATKEGIENGEFTFGTSGNMTKYLDTSNGGWTKYNTTDGKTVLDLEDDAAHVHMGGDWHMPTKEQMEELIGHTTSTWTSRNGVNGMLFTSNVNSNSLFVPAFDYIEENNFVFNQNGYIWGNSVREGDDLYCGWHLAFDSYNLKVSDFSRNRGLIVFGVVG